MFTVRVCSSTDIQKPVAMRDTTFETKREALKFIERLGELTYIRRFGRVYTVTPKK